jgi:ParB family chromosome partitioning protein
MAESKARRQQMDLSALDEHTGALHEDRQRQITDQSAETSDLDQVVAKISVDRLLPDPYQPRKAFSEAKIKELATSLEQDGLIEPLVVRPAQGAQNRGKYWVVSGERRLRAARDVLGWKEIDCRIKSLDPTRAAVLSLVLNVQREDLSEIEKAESLARLKTMTAGTWEAVAELTGISHGYARQLSSLLNVSDGVKDMVRGGQLAARTAIALKALPERDQQVWAEKAVEQGLTAEQVREQTQHIVRTRTSARTPDLQVPSRLENAAAYQAPDPNSTAPAEAFKPARSGTRTKLLQDSLMAVKNIHTAITRENWPPSEVTSAQQQLIHELYHELSMVHQELANIRMPFRPEPNKGEREEEVVTKRLLPY